MAYIFLERITKTMKIFYCFLLFTLYTGSLVAQFVGEPRLLTEGTRVLDPDNNIDELFHTEYNHPEIIQFSNDKKYLILQSSNLMCEIWNLNINTKIFAKKFDYCNPQARNLGIESGVQFSRNDNQIIQFEDSTISVYDWPSLQLRNKKTNIKYFNLTEKNNLIYVEFISDTMKTAYWDFEENVLVYGIYKKMEKSNFLYNCLHYGVFIYSSVSESEKISSMKIPIINENCFFIKYRSDTLSLFELKSEKIICSINTEIGNRIQFTQFDNYNKNIVLGVEHDSILIFNSVDGSNLLQLRDMTHHGNFGIKIYSDVFSGHSIHGFIILKNGTRYFYENNYEDTYGYLEPSWLTIVSNIVINNDTIKKLIENRNVKIDLIQGFVSDIEKYILIDLNTDSIIGTFNRYKEINGKENVEKPDYYGVNLNEPTSNINFTVSQLGELNMINKKTNKIVLKHKLINQKDFLTITPEGKFNCSENVFKYLYVVKDGKIDTMEEYKKKYFDQNLWYNTYKENE